MRQPQETNAQVAFKGIMEAFSAGKLEYTSPFVLAALAWAMERIGQHPKPAQKSTTEPKNPIEQRTAEIDKVQSGTSGKDVDVEQAESEIVADKVDKMFLWVAENMNFKNTTPVRTWIINRCKIDKDRIESDTENVMKEIAEIQNWTLPV